MSREAHSAKTAELRGLAEAAAALRPGPWYFDGRDIFTEQFDADGHRLLIPLPETFHPSQRVPDEIAAYIAAADPTTVLELLDARASFARGGDAS